MRRFAAAVSIAALGGAVLAAAPALAGEPAGPACVRVRIGSGRACLTLGWYVGLWRAIDERAVEVGLRFTLGGAPPSRVRAAPAAPVGATALHEPGPAPPAGGGVAELLAAVAAYGLAPVAGGLDRFVAGPAGDAGGELALPGLGRGTDVEAVDPGPIRR